jgi:hypothetical protein
MACKEKSLTPYFSMNNCLKFPPKELILYKFKAISSVLLYPTMQNIPFFHDFFLYCFREEERASDVHAIPDFGTGEGIPLQPLPDQKAKDRDCPRSVPH